MNKRLLKLLTLITLCVVVNCVDATAQNQVYWREGFEPAPSPATLQACNLTTTIPTSSGGFYFNGNTGVWYGFNVFRTTGTGCPAGNNHVRYRNIIGVTDSGYLVTPIVNFGIKELHFLRARVSRFYSVWVTSDTLATTTNWTPVTPIRSFAGTQTCTDTTILINSATAKRMKLVCTPGLDTDIDSLFITSFAAIVLPVKFSSLAVSTNNGLAKVIWNIETAINTQNYEVQRSADGINFTTIGTVTATNTAKYTYIDAAATNTSNYYRIKAVDNDGTFLYSQVVHSVGKMQVPNLTVYPNPVINKQLNIQLSNLSEGSYQLKVFNTLGQVILNKAVQFVGGTTSFNLQLPTSTNAGLYKLAVSNGVTSFDKTLYVQ